MFRNVVKEEVKISAQMRNLTQFRDFIGKIGQKYRYDAKIVNSLKLVVDEICTNIIRHGYRDVKNGEILLVAVIRRLSLTLIVVDRGKSFDPRTSKDPDLAKYVNMGKKGGLGTFMVRKLVDDIQYSVTSRGNELRLTKYREAPDESIIVRFWNRLSLRLRIVSISALVLITVGAVSFIYFDKKVKENAIVNTAETLSSINSNLAQVVIEHLKNDNIIPIFEEEKLIHDSNSDIVSQAVVFDTLWQPMAMFPVDLKYYAKKNIVKDFSKANITKEARFFQYNNSTDSSLFAFVAPVSDSTYSNSVLGYSVIYSDHPFVRSRIAKKRLELIVTLLLVLLSVFVGVYGLVTLIVSPFQKLANWVRQVGKGTIDEDELDIDTSDELGEIAQAFNEMTVKFRESQQSLIERQRMHRELQVAQEIQQMLLPTDFPEVFGYDITSYYQAAKEVGGDLYDFVEVDDNTIGIIVADVSGKGVPGSMVMTMIRTALRMEARGNTDPGDVLSKVNDFVTGDIRKGMFVTAFYVILDSRNRIISYASAGHNPITLFRGKSKETFFLNPPGFPLGITLPDPGLFARTIRTDKIRLHPDDVLTVYTDGVTEAMNPKRELFSEGRYLSVIRKYGELNVVDFVKNIQAELSAFTSGFEQNDDITLVAIKESMDAEDMKLKLITQLFEKVDSKEISITLGCQESGISPTSFYRYRKLYEKGGEDSLLDYLQSAVKNYSKDQKSLFHEGHIQEKLENIMLLMDAGRKKETSVKKMCKEFKVSAPTYYRYKKIFEEGGYQHLRESLYGYTSLGMQHMSIELKTKLYDIIQNFPHYGPKRIAKMLNTEKYGNTDILPKFIYEELKRAKLSSKTQRQAFVKRGGKQRLKPPGTPLLTLDGDIIVGSGGNDKDQAEGLFSTTPVISGGVAKERIISARKGASEGEDEKEEKKISVSESSEG